VLRIRIAFTLIRDIERAMVVDCGFAGWKWWVVIVVVVYRDVVNLSGGLRPKLLVYEAFGLHSFMFILSFTSFASDLVLVRRQ
jgi:hypothetical protein